MKNALAPILSEIKLLRKSVHADYNKLHSDYTRLEKVITKKSTEVETTLTDKIDCNTQKILQITAENIELKEELQPKRAASTYQNRTDEKQHYK